MAGCSLAGGLGTSLVRLELLVLGMGGEPLGGEEHLSVDTGPRAVPAQGRQALPFSPGLVDVRALAGGAGRGRLGQGARVQDPLGPSVHRRLVAKQPEEAMKRSQCGRAGADKHQAASQDNQVDLLRVLTDPSSPRGQALLRGAGGSQREQAALQQLLSWVREAPSWMEASSPGLGSVRTPPRMDRIGI